MAKLDLPAIAVIMSNMDIRRNFSVQHKADLQTRLEKILAIRSDLDIVEHVVVMSKRYAEILLQQPGTDKTLTIKYSMDGGYSYSGNIDLGADI